MPKDNSIKKVLIIGSGPIIIGQGCEFDYSGTQACKALKEEGCLVVLINSNPATIMTDPELADATYIEPITKDIIEKIIEIEKPDAILPTMGGQKALNCSIQLHETGVLQKHSVKLIGLSADSIKKAENRNLFKKSIKKIGLQIAKSIHVQTILEALQAQQKLGFPIIIRCSFTLGGYGGGIAYNIKEFKELCSHALNISPSGLLIEQSLVGWKEYELEIVRDNAGNCIVVCGIENIDPMGIHTGDSITVAPIQTLTDKEFQRMRLAAFQIMSEIGMTSGGCNVQFAVNPKNGTMLCIEINPRVSRSSALASKATGFPIAKIATKIALGYNLKEIKNDLTGGNLPSSFEPTMDYVVTKIPFFNFEQFPNVNTTLTTSMKSIGEVMGIGRTFQESLQKAICSLEIENKNLKKQLTLYTNFELFNKLKKPSSNRLWYISEAFRRKWSIDKVHELTKYDKWFLAQILDLTIYEKRISQTNIDQLNAKTLHYWKQKGFSDYHIGQLMNISENEIKQKRTKLAINPTYKKIDTCAAEFPCQSTYMYSTYETECETTPSTKEKIVILGSGANRIGQGIEFDYCCVHASKTVRECGYESIMINCNPETVSTDYDISDRLYFEPISTEHVMSIIQCEKPKGVILQFGGQTPLNIAKQLNNLNVPILGTPFSSLHQAEDRTLFCNFLKKLNLKQSKHGVFSSQTEAIKICKNIGYPVILRPSYVIGGHSIKVINNESQLIKYLNRYHQYDGCFGLVESFLKEGIEAEIDAICDGKEIYICGIIEHFDPIGIHSGDSIASLTPHSLPLEIQQQLIKQTKQIANAMNIIGAFNVQFAIANQTIYVLEVNPRASRTIPILAKTTSTPFVKIATKCLLGESLHEQKKCYSIKKSSPYFAIKLPVFSFHKLPGCARLLGTQMKSTGEALSIGRTFEEALEKIKIYFQSDIDNFSKNIINFLPTKSKQPPLYKLQQPKQPQTAVI